MNKHSILPSIALILYLFSISVLTQGCFPSVKGNGKMITRQVDVNQFNKLEINGLFSVNLIKGLTNEVEIVADENIHEHIKVTSNIGVLKIDIKDHVVSQDGLTLNITYVNITDIDVAGGILLTSKSVLKTKELNIDGAGAIDMQLELNTQELNVDLAGAADVQLSGKAQYAIVEISGAADLQAKQLKTSELKIDISGAGSADVYALNKLDINISGAGAVAFRGNPIVTQNISGAGSVSQIN